MSLALGQAAKAAPGDLDPSFDADGLVLTHFGRIDDDSPAGRDDFASAVVVQPDGKLVVAGTSAAGGGVFFVSNIEIARYNPDGSLDTSFGSGGRVLADFGGEFDAFGEPRLGGFVLQPDGRLMLLVAAEFNAPFAVELARFVLSRYNPDGSPDTNFGSGGRLRIPVSQSDIGGVLPTVDTSMMQTNGKLIVLGRKFGDFPDFSNSLVLLRYNPDGSLDPSFGSGGRAETAFDQGSFPRGTRLTQQSDGKLVLLGSIPDENFATEALLLLRFNTDGNLDTGFGFGGRVNTDLGTQSLSARGLIRQTDGKLVVAGTVDRDLSDDSGLHEDFFLARYNPDGNLDPSFGSGGLLVPAALETEFLFAFFGAGLVVQGDGKLVAAGSSLDADNAFVLIRYNPDGSRDSSFGTGGLVFTEFSGRIDFLGDFAESLVVQPDGKLVAVGTSQASGDFDFALARYLVTDEPAPRRRCGGRPATMLGTPGNDTLRGTFFGRDVILGLGGNDTIRGLGGEDILCGGRGNDVLIGGDDADQLYGGTGKDKLFGDRGLSAFDGDDGLYGGPGRDTLVADGGADLLFGEGGNDRLLGDAGQDTLDGGEGRDRCRDRLGRNTVESCENGRVPRPPEPPRDPSPSNPSACLPNAPGGCSGN